jgi:hypothetical protein
MIWHGFPVLRLLLAWVAATGRSAWIFARLDRCARPGAEAVHSHPEPAEQHGRPARKGRPKIADVMAGDSQGFTFAVVKRCLKQGMSQRQRSWIAGLRSDSERFSAASGYFYPVIPAQAGIQEFAAQMTEIRDQSSDQLPAASPPHELLIPDL